MLYCLKNYTCTDNVLLKMLDFLLYVPFLCTCHKYCDVCFMKRVALRDVMRALCCSWYVAFWDPCEAKCGEGEQVRTVFCQMAQAHDDAYIMVEDDVCLDNPRPRSTRPCNTGVPCPEVEKPAVEVEEPVPEVDEPATEVEEPMVEVDEPIIVPEDWSLLGTSEEVTQPEEPLEPVDEPIIVPEDWSLLGTTEEETLPEEPLEPVDEPIIVPEDEPLLETSEEAAQPEEPLEPVDEPIIVPENEPLLETSEEEQLEPVEEPIIVPENEPLLETSEEEPLEPVDEPIIVPENEPLLETSEEAAQPEEPLEPVSPSEDEEPLHETSQEMTQPEDDVAQPKDVSPSENLVEPEASQLGDSDLGMSLEWDVSDLFPVTASRPKKLSANVEINQPLTEVITVAWDIGAWSAVSFSRLRDIHCTQHTTMNIC